MKPQARPFTVEVKSKRRPLHASHTNWSTVIDEPSPDDLPSRDVRDDAADTPLAAASRAFSASATNAISSASTLSILATSVFTPGPQKVSAGHVEATDEVRTGRILPSLLPLNPFDAAAVQEDKPVRRKATRRRKAVVGAEEQPATPEPIELAAAPANELMAAATSTSPSWKASRRGSTARVRAGEGWKRRRLPKAFW